MVGNIAELTKEDGKRWRRYLADARRRANLGGVLLVLDGDLARIRGEAFYPFRFGSRLAGWARDVGAGALFSVASVFACQEYESWLIACAGRLAGLALPDGRPGIAADAMPPEGNLEVHPRDAKRWLDQRLDDGYKESRDQELLTRLMVDQLGAIRERGMRSFRRLETALRQLVEAIRSGKHVATPPAPPS
jgi:hypothetical protein